MHRLGGDTGVPLGSYPMSFDSGTQAPIAVLVSKVTKTLEKCPKKGATNTTSFPLGHRVDRNAPQAPKRIPNPLARQIASLYNICTSTILSPPFPFVVFAKSAPNVVNHRTALGTIVTNSVKYSIANELSNAQWV
jgi:hypothetical protein